MSTLSRLPSTLTGVVEVHPDSAVVTLVGALQRNATPVLTAMLAAATAGGGAVTVDVAGVTSIDRTGLGVLQQLAASLREEGRVLDVLGAGPAMHDVLAYAELLDEPGATTLTTAAPALLRELVDRAGSGATRDILDAALLLVVTMAQAVIGKADGVSITLPCDGRYGTVAASNDVVMGMDHDQYDTDQGPCLDAARLGEPFDVDALEAEERWPYFVPRARARGIASIRSSPLLDTGSPHGALNLYSRTAGAFTADEKRWADEFAAQASTVLTVAHEALPAEHLIGQLELALASRAVISRAQGWVMQRDSVDADTAWSVLTDTSRRTSRPLRDVSEDLLRAADDPSGGARERRSP